ncbi:MAG: ABC transporter permease [Anaerolineae bacterium]|jgi:ABC-2 type transport system permease protein|nr:ABC transporter permease [Anaerolineae bacterium]
MRHIFTIARHDLQVFFADRANWFGLVLMPIMLTLIVGGAFGGGSGELRLRVDVVDQDGSPAAADLVAAIGRANPTLYFCPQQATADRFNCEIAVDKPLDVATAQERVRRGDTNALIVIPAGYGAALQTFQPLTIAYYSLADVTTGDIVAAALDAAIAQVNGAVVAAQVGGTVGDTFHRGATAANPSIFRDAADRQAFTQQVAARADALLQAQPLTVTYTIAQLRPQERPLVTTQGFGQSVPGMGSMFVMFTVLGMLPIINKERKQWTLQRLVTLPLRPAVILGGKVLALFTLGMIQFAIVFGVGVAIGTDFGSAPAAILLVMLAFTLCITALTIALATRIRSEDQANGLSFLLAMVLAPIGGAWWPFEIMPEVMQMIGRLSPVSWAMEGFRQVIFFGGGLAEVLPGVGVLLAAAAVFFIIGVRGFRYE